MLIGYTVQPVMFVLLFVYVFGGSIDTGMDYEDFLIPGILVQNITFGGALTAVGLVEDLNKGLIDRFRSLPMARSAVLTGRTLADVVVNLFGVIIILIVGFVVGFRFNSSVPEIALRDRSCCCCSATRSAGCSRSCGLYSSSAETAQQIGFILIFPLTFISSAFVPVDNMPARAGGVRGGESVHRDGRCDAPSLRRHAGREFRVGSDFVVDRPDRRLRAAGRTEVPSRFRALGWRTSHKSRARAGVLSA